MARISIRNMPYIQSKDARLHEALTDLLNHVSGLSGTSQQQAMVPPRKVVAGGGAVVSSSTPGPQGPSGPQGIQGPPGISVSFSDAEVVAGSGTSWTLANAPSPATSLLLVQEVLGFGGILLIAGTDYTLAGTAITTTNSLSAGALRAWYRY